MKKPLKPQTVKKKIKSKPGQRQAEKIAPVSSLLTDEHEKPVINPNKW
jgi:hypothetical protein